LFVREGWNNRRQPRQRGHDGGGDCLKPHRGSWWRRGGDKQQLCGGD
jgi:hypothetical protein